MIIKKKTSLCKSNVKTKLPCFWEKLILGSYLMQRIDNFQSNFTEKEQFFYQISSTYSVLQHVKYLQQFPLTPKGSQVTQNMSQNTRKISTFWHQDVNISPKWNIFTKKHVSIRGPKELKLRKLNISLVFYHNPI